MKFGEFLDIAIKERTCLIFFNLGVLKTFNSRFHEMLIKSKLGRESI